MLEDILICFFRATKSYLKSVQIGIIMAIIFFTIRYINLT